LGGPLFISKEIAMSKLIDKNAVDLSGSFEDFHQDGKNVIRQSSQDISQAFLDDLKNARNESTQKPTGDFMRVASIPVVIVEKWMREGFNVWEASGQEIVKKLKNENLDAFMATEKRI
jgi:hypothetical protein